MLLVSNMSTIFFLNQCLRSSVHQMSSVFFYMDVINYIKVSNLYSKDVCSISKRLYKNHIFLSYFFSFKNKFK